ncbi:hypothetical protein VNO77_18598 [Canavalia gladiata]|uniref:Uncharacterized protein n=1 Tax=Canavalia gladiata TaxID=3824 RepID=A0AAN9LR40_CANGL
MYYSITPAYLLVSLFPSPHACYIAYRDCDCRVSHTQCVDWISRNVIHFLSISLSPLLSLVYGILRAFPWTKEGGGGMKQSRIDWDGNPLVYLHLQLREGKCPCLALFFILICTLLYSRPPKSLRIPSKTNPGV